MGGTVLPKHTVPANFAFTIHIQNKHTNNHISFLAIQQVSESEHLAGISD